MYFSERFWRILKSREPRLEVKDSSSSMMSSGTLTFFPGSISASGQAETGRDKQASQLEVAGKLGSIFDLIFHT